MNLVRNLSLFFLLVCSVVPVAHSTESSALIVDSTTRTLSLARQAYVLEDRDKTLSLDDVRALGDEHWQPSGVEVLNFSFSKSAYWIRLELINLSVQAREMLLEAAMPLHDYFDVYYLQEDQLLKQYSTGDRRAYDSRPVNTRNFVFPIELAAQKSLTVYMRVDTHDGLYDAIPLNLWDPEDYSVENEYVSHIFGYYYGAILALIIYNLLLFISTRERLFIYYSAYLIAFFVWNVTFRGYAYEYFWPQWVVFNNQILAISGSLIFIFLTLFSFKFLPVHQNSPVLYRALVMLMVANLITLPMSMMNIYATSFLIIIPSGILSMILLMLVAGKSSLMGSRPARLFLLAWTILILSALIYYLRVFAILPSNFITENGLNIGSALEFLLLAYALADQINTLKNEKMQAEQRVLDAQLTLTRSLEDKVRERTIELEHLNEKFKTASITDEMTGLYNRRYYNEVIDKQINRARRENRIFVYAIIDVDRFKEYNDTYGHQKGDEVLQKLARLIKSILQRSSDIVFRMGGEEFCIISSVEHEDQGRALMEKLRQGILDLSIEHQGSELGILSASIGLVMLSDYTDSGSKQLYAQADKALYRAKSAGRNRVAD